MAKHLPCNLCGTPAACETGCRIDAAAAEYRGAAECAARIRIEPRASEETLRTIGDEMDRRDRDLAAAAGKWRNRREMAEDLILVVLMAIGAITVLRWILDATGVTAWLGWW